VRGLTDGRLAAALRGMHEHPTRAWTVAELAREAALSRSTFFERFSRAVGVAPMEYLLNWRMALAKDLLRRNAGRVAEVAERVGYSSASTFSVAFTRHVGQPPAQYAREEQAAANAQE
jgi:transcriptional regulator GlxA family with amidase domain